MMNGRITTYSGNIAAVMRKTVCRRYVFCFLAGAAALMIHAAYLPAQQGEVSVESRLDKSTVTVGELAKYEIIITFTPDVQVAVPPDGINLGGFEIRDYMPYDPAERDGKIERRVEYTIAAYDTGSYVIPPTGIVYMLPDSTQDILMTDAVPVTVESVLSSDSDDILDIKLPLEIPRNFFMIILVSAAVIFAAAAGVLGYTYYRKKKKGGKPFDIRNEPDLPAHEEAVTALHRLRQSSLIAEGKIKEYYSELSDILRYYFQRRYFKPFLEMTTSEIKEILREDHINEEALIKTGSVLDLADLVKFAKVRPESEDHERTFDDACEIVDLTKIVMTPEPEDDAGGETVQYVEDGINDPHNNEKV
ncbi:hypothetical protein ACFL4Q_04510 [candidate division KSB1 bacterium]